MTKSKSHYWQSRHFLHTVADENHGIDFNTLFKFHRIFYGDQNEDALNLTMLSLCV